ncbi:hypothetical protein DOY81_013118 [Sarcophaga bullata]|nr:hypothetical protein DOY81_013118 [Sarcophaga bullata]
MKQQQLKQLQRTQQNVCHQQKFKVQFLLSILCLMATTAWADDYLKEAPSFLQPCKLKDSGNSDCVAKAVENIFTNWGPGVPGLKI